MRLPHRLISVWFSLVLLIPLFGCGGGDATQPQQAPGSIRATATQSGDDLDPDGFAVSLDGGSTRVLIPGDTTSFTLLQAGMHSVELSGVADNCSVDSENPQSVSLSEGETVTVGFQVGCDEIILAHAVWLQENAVPFQTADPAYRQGDYSDLMPLKEIIGDARVVALGEATHGTRQFFQMKHRLLEFLVTELDFNVFAIEATWPESNRIDSWVHGAPGNPMTLLSGLYFWTWNTREVLAMIEWMRTHNMGGGQPTVSFTGFDMQFPGMAIHNVIAFLENVDTAGASLATNRYSCMTPYANDPSGAFQNDYADASNAYQDQCKAALDEVFSLLESNESAYTAASSPAEFARALRSARVVIQFEDMKAERTLMARDFYMAENAEWILDQAGPNSKIVLWAHNGHVRSAPLWMGSHLHAEYGDDMVIVGFDFYQGSFQAITISGSGQYLGLDVHHVGPPPSDSYEAYFSDAKLSLMILDLRGIQFNSPETSWLEGPRAHRSIGAVFMPSHPEYYFYDARMPQEYDVVIYFQDTQAALGLPYNPPNDW